MKNKINLDIGLTEKDIEERVRLLSDFGRAREHYKKKIAEPTLNKAETAVRGIVNSLSLKRC